MENFTHPLRNLDFHLLANEEKLWNDFEQESHIVSFACYRSNCKSSDNKELKGNKSER